MVAEPDRRRARVDAFLAEVDAIVTDDFRAAVRAAEQGLYDESGMPRQAGEFGTDVRRVV